MTDDPFQDLPAAGDPFADLPPVSDQSAASDSEEDSPIQPSPRAISPLPTSRVFESEPPTSGPIGGRDHPEDPFSSLPVADPFSDVPPKPVARAEGRGFWNNFRLSDLQRAAENESMAANIMKFVTGNTDEKQREIQRRFQSDLTERELDDAAEHYFQQEGFEGENYQLAQASLDAYREARANPDFNLEMVKEAITADPGAFMAEVAKYMIIDPQLMFTPMGWTRAAAAASRAAKAAGAGVTAERAARVAGGTAGSAGAGAAVELPIAVARQLGEGGEVTDPGRIATETGLAAAGSALIAGGYKGTVAGLRAGREAAGRARLDRDINRSTTPAEPTTSTRQTEHGEVVVGEPELLTRLPDTSEGRVDLNPERDLENPYESEFDDPYGLGSDLDFIFHRPGTEPGELDTDFVIDYGDSTIQPARLVDLEDLQRLEAEEANARQFYEAEAKAADETGLEGGVDRVGTSGRGADSLEGRDRYEPGADEEDGTVIRDTDDGDFPQSQQPRGPRPRVGDGGAGRTAPIAGNATEQVADALRFGQTVRHTDVDRLPTAIRQVKHPEEVAHLSARIRKDPQETLMVVATDDAGQVLRVSRIGRGTQRNAPAHPGLVAATGVSAPGARRLWIIHNHPTGRPKHSRSDTDFAENLQELLRDTGVKFEGSVVVAPTGQFTHFHPDPSLRQVAEPRPIPAGLRGESQPVSERRFTRATPAQTSSGEPVPSVKQPGGLEGIFEGLGGREGLVLTNNLGQPQAFLPLSRDQMLQLRQPETFRRLVGEFDTTNATGFAARINSDAEDDLERVARNLEGFSNQAGYTFHDVYSPEWGKASDLGTDTSARTFYSNPFLEAGKAVGRGVVRHPGRSAASSFAGGVAGATLSDDEPGSAKWWADLALGAAAGVSLSHVIRATNLLGAGSVVDNSRARLGTAIDNLPLIGRGPHELRDLKRKQRLMKEYIERQTAEIGRELLDRFTPSERAMMADLIENRGIIQDFNLVHQQAQALDDYLTFVTRRQKELGMLTEDLEEGGYLHRYYAKHLGLDGSFRKAKQQSLAGSYTINRGTIEPFEREYLSPRAQELSDQYDLIKDELELVKKRGDLLDDDPVLAARRDALEADLRELRETELHEYMGLQNGKLRSFIFRADEVPRVETGGEGDDLVKAFEHRGRAGELDDRTGPIIPGVERLEPTDRVWSVRGVHRTKKGVALRRDWTKAERQSWGEIDDVGYRFVRGMAEVAHDLSLATMFENVARRSDWASREKVDGWFQVPTSKVNKNSPLRKYGALSGMWVDPRIWNGIKRHGRNTLGESQLAKRYQDLNNKWKIYKTVYNPVTHINNTYSNFEMLLMSDHQLGDLWNAWTMMRQGENSQVWREASNAGLFGNDFTASVIRGSEGGNSQILQDLAEQLRNQDEIPDAELATHAFLRMKEWWINSKNALDEADSAWGTGAALAKAMGRPVLTGLKTANKPVKAATRAMTRAYRFEDNIFKLAVFSASRKKGMSIDESVREAQGLFFDYQDIPDAIRWARDLPIGSPFITYTYFAAQAVAKNAVQHPEKVLALIAGYEAMNYAALVADGMSPGEYWAVESAEEDLSPPWDRGRALWGAKNTIRIPGLDGYRLALGRAHALGNPFMTDAGGREKLPNMPMLTNFWGSSVFGSNPAHALLDIGVNEDWRGKEIYHPGDPTEEKITKSINYLYQSWSPSNPLFPGSYHQQKILEGLANQARTEDSEIITPVVDAANGVAEALGWQQFTGLNRIGDEIKTTDAVLGAFGVKLRPIRHELSLDFEQSKINREIREIDRSIDEKSRLYGEERITERQLDTALQRRGQDQQALIDEQIHLEDQADVLRDQGLFRSER